MGILTACFPESIFRRAFDLRRIHRALGLSSLGLTTHAIVSGVMDALPTGINSSLVCCSCSVTFLTRSLHLPQ